MISFLILRLICFCGSILQLSISIIDFFIPFINQNCLGAWILIKNFATIFHKSDYLFYNIFYNDTKHLLQPTKLSLKISLHSRPVIFAQLSWTPTSLSTSHSGNAKTDFEEELAEDKADLDEAEFYFDNAVADFKRAEAKIAEAEPGLDTDIEEDEDTTPF